MSPTASRRPSLPLVAVVAASFLALPATAETPVAAGCPPGEKLRVAAPEVVDPFWMPLRQMAETMLSKGYQVDHAFRFTDRLAESGITFQHQIVEDAGKRYKPVHYDHGNGLAVADVDGDSRLDVYFTSQLGSNELWRNAGGGRFELLADAGVALTDQVSVTASFADADNDGDPDLFVSTVRFGNHLFENDGKGRFRDVSKEAGLDYVGHSSGAVFFDYDNDGLLDLFVTNVGRYTTDVRGPGGYWVGYEQAFWGHLEPERSELSRLYRNLGDLRFEDVTEKAGLGDDGWSGDAAAVDLDEDGFVDLYALNMQGHDEVWRNVEGRRFERAGRRWFPATPWGAMGVKAFDYDNDGRLDLFLTDMHTDMIEILPPTKEKSKIAHVPDPTRLATDGNHVMGNALFHNDGDGKWSEVSTALGAENFWPWGPSVGDVNADGFLDVFIASSMNYPWRYGVNSLLLNEGGRRFVDAVFLTGIEPRTGGATAKPWFDLDCAGADAEHGECKGRSGCITVMGALGSRSAVIFDLDDDGDLDVVTNELNAPPMVLVSDLAAKKPLRYLEVDLVGTRSNRSGLGARVTVEAGGKRYLQVNDGSSGYLSHSDMPLYFGLGDATAVDAVEVRWPSGAVQRVPPPIALGSTLVVTEQAGAP